MVGIPAEYEVFTWVIIPLLIFFARLVDVSLGTLRVIFISKGLKYVAPVVGFFEVIIWLVAISQVMTNITNVYSYIAYGSGFAAGTFLGMAVEERLLLGTVVVRVITKRDASALVSHLRGEGYGITVMDAEGSTGKVRVLLMIIKRQNLPKVVGTITQFNPHAFYSIEDVKSVTEGVFPGKKTGFSVNWRDPMGFFRKGK